MNKELREILRILDYELEGIQIKGSRKGTIDRAQQAITKLFMDSVPDIEKIVDFYLTTDNYIKPVTHKRLLRELPKAITDQITERWSDETNRKARRKN